MKCPNCNTEMSCRIGTHNFVESGLDNVEIINTEICECSCGEKVVSIPNVEEMLGNIGFALTKKESLLNAKEIRFLRKNMGLTAKKLGEYMSIDNATISRWEKGTQSISISHDKFLRLLYRNIKGSPTKEIRRLIEKDFRRISPEEKRAQRYKFPIV